jgi:hypothetical protein
MVKTYGAPVAELSKAEAERFFPRTRASRAKEKEDSRG